MKPLHLLRAFVALTFLLSFSACSKKGDPGTPGQNGKDGTNGAPGNNVIISDSLSLTDTDFTDGWYTYTTSGGGTSARAARVATVTVDSLTSAVASEGLVSVYYRTNSTLAASPDQWTQLPFQIPSFSSDYLINIAAAFEPGKIRIYYYFEPIASSTPNIYTATVPPITIRYVLIPGRSLLGSTAPAHFVNETDLKAYFHIR